MTRIDVPSHGSDNCTVHCILDKNRHLPLEAIEKSVELGDVVVEAGLGTGIMSIMAATLGAEVYGIEINKDTLDLARQLSRVFIENGFFKEKNLNLVEADASTWTPMKQIDLIISENIYAGMFYEMQIPIVNHLLPFISTSGRVVPEVMSSYVILAQAEKPSNKRPVNRSLLPWQKAEYINLKSFPNQFHITPSILIGKMIAIAGSI